MKEQEAYMERDRTIEEKFVVVPKRDSYAVVVSNREDFDWKNSTDRQRTLKDYENPWLAKDNWYRKFGDSVPDYFPVWHKTEEVINNAAKNNTQLEPNIVAAAALHPSRAVVMALASNYLLPKALGEIVSNRPDLMDNDKLSIKFAQRRLSSTGK